MAKERSNSDEIRVQVPLSPEVIAKVDELAELMGGIGRGRMAAMLLEEGIRDNQWIIKIVTSRYMKPVRDLVHHWTDLAEKKSKEKRSDPTTQDN